MASAAFGPTWSDLVLNAVFRGVIGTPPSTLYFSLGAAGSKFITSELTGMVRQPLKCNRGAFSGTDSTTYPYQSTGTLGFATTMNTPLDVYVTGIGASSITSPTVLVYDAPTAGNLLYAFNMAGNIIDGDVIRLGQGCSGQDFVSGVVSGVDDGMEFGARSSGGAGNQDIMGSYMYSLIVDWLLRGFNSMNTLFPTGTFPNVYLVLCDVANNEITAIPRIALPRTTGSWAAPVANAPGVDLQRKLVSTAAFTSGPTTGSGSFNNIRAVFRMSNVAQSFDDTIYTIRLNDSPAITFGVGDTIQFASGQLEILFGGGH